MKKLLIGSALKTQGIVSTTKNPYVLLRDLSNCFITYEINAYTNQPNNLIWIKSDLINKMLDEFKQAGIEIVSPQPRGRKGLHTHNASYAVSTS